MGQKINKNSNVIWDLFSSVRLTLVLLILLALTSIIGTLIPQQDGAVRFAQNLSPGLFRLFSFLQLFDLYHSIWFRVIIGLLAINLIICSLDRFPATLRLFRAFPKPDRSKPFENSPPHRHLQVKGSSEDISTRAVGVLKSRYKKIEEKQTQEGHFLYGDKGRFSYFGVYLVHLSVLFILVGGIIGSFFGLEAYVNIHEGDSVGIVNYRKGGAPKKLGFDVRCDKFYVDFYDNGSPKEYRSDISFVSNGKVASKGKLLVNHPLTFRGITFYQSSYGTIPGDKVRVNISRNAGTRDAESMVVQIGKPIALPGKDGQFRVLEVNENFRGMMGPAALISVANNSGEETRFLIFKFIESLKQRFPPAMFQAPILNHSAFKPYSFSLEGIESKYYTGLQVNRDPGVSFVWIGCFLMIVGFFITFFTSHQGVWVRITGKEGSIQVSIAGRSNKNPVGLEKELDQITDKLETTMGH